ncbi:hypothetical protein PG995_001411 [Apiospora arundinis]
MVVIRHELHESRSPNALPPPAYSLPSCRTSLVGIPIDSGASSPPWTKIHFKSVQAPEQPRESSASDRIQTGTILGKNMA